MPRSHILRTITTATFLLCGVGLLWNAAFSDLQANLTGQGADAIMERQAAGEAALQAGHGAAMAQTIQGPVAAQMILGMILIITGFMLHATMVVRERTSAKSRKLPPVHMYIAWFKGRLH